MKMQKNALKLFLLIGLTLKSVSAFSEQVLYRYKDDNGIQVLNSSIPNKYIGNGYEILNRQGQVIEVVPPAPTKEELAKQKITDSILQRYIILRRKYSSIEDIKRAKQRRLDNIDTNIAILNANLSGLKTRIQNLMSDAARKERATGNVPKVITNQIDNTKAEIEVTEGILVKRQEEYRIESDKFDDDVAAFIQGQEVESMQHEKGS